MDARTELARRAIERWRSRLLDLSRRNALLYFRGSRSTRLRIKAPAPPDLYDALVDRGKVLSFPAPRRVDADSAAYAIVDEEGSQTPVTERPGDLAVDYEQSSAKDVVSLQQKLLRLFKNQQQQEEERGINTLHLTFGILHWREPGAERRASETAPLVLVKVRLQREPHGPFTLSAEEPDPVTNPTLRTYLRAEYQLDLPEFGGNRDKRGDADLVAYLAHIEQLVEPLEFRVSLECWLSHFSFEKVVMWEDLGRPDTDQEVADHPVLAAMIGARDYPAVPVPEESLRPEAFEEPSTFPVLDADSSQLEVMAQIRTHNSLVVEGPPGTGKSQTIVNIIADALRRGERVLFVSQKRAALEVVHRRLRERGLDHLCLELHSHRAHRKDVVARLAEELDRSLSPCPDPVNPEVFSQYVERRRQLDQYVAALHRPRGKARYSAYRVHGELVRLAGVPDLRIDINALALTREKEQLLLDAVRAVAASGVWGREATHPWRGARLELPLVSIRLDLLDQLDALAEALEAATHLAEEVGATFGPGLAPTTPTELAWTSTALELLSTPPQMLCATWLTAPQSARRRWLTAIGRAQRELEVLHRALQQLDAADARGLLRAPDTVREVRSRYVSRYTRALARLSSDYRTDRAQLRELIGHKLRYPDARSALDAAIVVLDAAARIQEQASDLYDAVSDLPRPTVGPDLPPEVLPADLPLDTAWWSAVADGIRWCDQFAGTLFDFSAEDTELASEDAEEDPPTPIGDTSAQRIVALHRGDLLPDTASRMAAEVEGVAAELSARLDPFRSLFPDGFDGFDLEEHTLTTLSDLVREWKEHLDLLEEWRRHQRALERASELGLDQFLEDARAANVPANVLEHALLRALRLRWIREVYAREPALARFEGEDHERLIAEFRHLDRELLDVAAAHTAAIAHERQRPVRIAEQYRSVGGRPGRERPDNDPLVQRLKPQIRLLNAEARKSRRHKPIRQLLPELSDLVGLLTPCIMASPLSVATYLPRTAFQFDLVLIDEASQLLPEDAVGAILRGERVVAFGDSKQLPPTQFFTRLVDEEEQLEEELEELPDDVQPEDVTAYESILDAMGGRVPTAWLRWHYRSRDERLIAFSNHHFYREKPLITFPAPERRPRDRGVRLHVVDGLYEPGRKVNLPEARAIVDLVIQHLDEHPERSLGVIALGLSQAEIIERLLVERARADRRLDHLVAPADDEPEPFFIKNLENVQGDERDEIILSIGYGPTHPGGPVPLRFGPINRVGGERRLNVAVTRARYRTTVVCSFPPEALTRTAELRNIGPRLLYEYVLYCQREGELPEPPQLDPTRFPDSPFEEEVLEALRSAGYEVDPQVGASAFRIDLAVRDPRAPERYLVGIECDGATYHSSPAARDRDRLRQEILENLGWRIIRIWSTDWMEDPQRELSRLIDRIEELLRTTPAPTPGPA